MKKTVLILAGVLLPVFEAPAATANIGVDVSANAFAGIAALPWSLGFAFTVNDPVTIDSLLFFDYESNGIGGAENIVVSIFPDDTTTVPVSGLTATFNSSVTDVFTGNAAPFGQWLTIDVVDAVLGPGNYTAIAQGIISGAAGNSVAFNATVVPGAGLSYGGARSGSGIVNPSGNQLINSGGHFGPNFTFVPEPSRALLILLGAAGVVMRRRRA